MGNDFFSFLMYPTTLEKFCAIFFFYFTHFISYIYYIFFIYIPSITTIFYIPLNKLIFPLCSQSNLIEKKEFSYSFHCITQKIYQTFFLFFLLYNFFMCYMCVSSREKNPKANEITT